MLDMTYPQAIDEARDELQGLRDDVAAVRDNEAESDAQRAVLQDVLEFVEDAAQHRELLGTNPEKTFEAGLALLSDADRRLFMIRNVLESLKRNEDPRVALRHYQKMGLISSNATISPPSAEIAEEVERFQSGVARAAQWGAKQLKRATAVIAGLTVEAARAIPKLAKLKMGVTFVAGVPCPSFQIDAGSADWDFGELWQHVRTAYRNV